MKPLCPVTSCGFHLDVIMEILYISPACQPHKGRGLVFVSLLQFQPPAQSWHPVGAKCISVESMKKQKDPGMGHERPPGCQTLEEDNDRQGEVFSSHPTTSLACSVASTTQPKPGVQETVGKDDGGGPVPPPHVPQIHAGRRVLYHWEGEESIATPYPQTLPSPPTCVEWGSNRACLPGLSSQQGHMLRTVAVHRGSSVRTSSCCF